MAEPTTGISIREAARQLGCSRATLQRLLVAEPRLARAVIEHGGPRRATRLDMGILAPAWRQLAGTDSEDGLSDRQRLEQARRRRAWFDLKALEVELDQLDEDLVDAGDLQALHQRSLQGLRAAAAAWADRVGSELPQVPPHHAENWLNTSVHDALMEAIEHRPQAEQTRRTRDIAFPTDPPSLLRLKGEIEHVRAQITELRLRLQRGEKLDSRRASDQLLAEGIALRDSWRQVAIQLALRRRMLTSSERARTAALQELSRVGLT